MSRFSDKVVYPDRTRTPDKIKLKPPSAVGRFVVAGNEFIWVVGQRKDRRHGVVSEPVQLSDWTIELYDRMFSKWTTH